MKMLSLLSVLLFGLLVSSLKAEIELEQFEISGKPYVRLADWAITNKLQFTWQGSESPIRISDSSWNLSFQVDNRSFVLNGIKLLLLERIHVREGVPFIGSEDLQTILQPILFCKKNSPDSRVQTICVDPGHGGQATGWSQSAEPEKKFTLLLAQEVARLLKENKFTVVMTRDTDTDVSLSDRARIANDAKADLFVSLHFNGTESTKAHGLETFCVPPRGVFSTDANGNRVEGPRPPIPQVQRSMLLTYTVHRAILKGAPLDDHRLMRVGFKVLRDVQMPAILVEGGFMNDPGDYEKIGDPVFRTKLATSIVNGIVSYKQQVER